MNHGFHIAFGESQATRDNAYPDIVGGLIAPASLTILAAGPKSGKTDFATALAFAVASGRPFAGLPTHGGPVLWVAYEETPFERWSLDRQRPTLENGDPAPFYISYRVPALDFAPDREEEWYAPTPDALDVLDEAISEIQPVLIVIDTLIAGIQNTSLSHPQSARRIIGRLRRFASERHIAILLLHHLAKDRGGPADRSIAQSGQILAASSAHMVLAYADSIDADGVPGRSVTLTSVGRIVGPRVHRFWSPASLDYRPINAFTPLSCVARRILKCLSERRQTIAEIEAALDLTYDYARKGIVELIDKGFAVREPALDRRMILVTARPPDASAPN